MINQETIKEVIDTIHDNQDRVQNINFAEYIKDYVNDMFCSCESEKEVEEKKHSALEVIEKLKVLINQY